MSQKEKERIVLIIDDSVLIIDRLINFLTGKANISQLLIAYDFEEGLQKFSENKIDIVLLDLNLKNKSGIDLLKIIKTDRPEVKVVMFTNDSTPFIRQTCLALGASHVIDKSYEFEQVPAVIDSL